MKLSYFGANGRGFALRFALQVNGTQFEDQQLDFPTFGKMKAEGAFKYG